MHSGSCTEWTDSLNLIRIQIQQIKYGLITYKPSKLGQTEFVSKGMQNYKSPHVAVMICVTHLTHREILTDYIIHPVSQLS